MFFSIYYNIVIYEYNRDFFLNCMSDNLALFDTSHVNMMYQCTIYSSSEIIKEKLKS